MLSVKKVRTHCPSNELSSLSPSDKRNRWKSRERQENWPMAEIIWRALDAYLAWDDPTSTPVPKPCNSEDPFIPAAFAQGLSGSRSVQPSFCTKMEASF